MRAGTARTRTAEGTGGCRRESEALEGRAVQAGREDRRTACRDGQYHALVGGADRHRPGASVQDAQFPEVIAGLENGERHLLAPAARSQDPHSPRGDAVEKVGGIPLVEYGLAHLVVAKRRLRGQAREVRGVEKGEGRYAPEDFYRMDLPFSRHSFDTTASLHREKG